MPPITEDEIFTASNGYQLRQNERTGNRIEYRSGSYGSWKSDTATHSFSPKSVVGTAVSEYLIHLRDLELGRWRDPKFPQYVVYPSDTGDKNRVRVIDETTGFSYHLSREGVSGNERYPEISAAVRYFEAHPIRKPWDDAQPEDIWLIDGTPSYQDCWATWRHVGGNGREIDMSKASTGKLIYRKGETE